ncbi:unnamed protein product [Ranitomeya imitator]|uniref:Uncharacterized protein n=1 Tax=Ranitomeya imitator TaxID=111125 RepID=A0ABN9MLR1_9NEOB|nr:unnamed protein product [Ranitomeya imitator]
MDSSTYKRYHEDDFDSRQHLESYVSENPDSASHEDSLIFPIENLTKTFTEESLRKLHGWVPKISETIHSKLPRNNQQD